MKAEKIEAAIRRLIQTAEGIPTAKQLVGQVRGSGVIGDELAHSLLQMIEDEEVKYAMEGAIDGGPLDQKRFTFQQVLSSLENLAGGIKDQKTRELANRVAAIFGSTKGTQGLKEGADLTKIEEQVVEAPEGDDLGFSLISEPVERVVRPAWLSRGEFVMSVPAVEGLGLREGASPEKAHEAGIEALKRMHEELRGHALHPCFG